MIRRICLQWRSRFTGYVLLLLCGSGTLPAYSQLPDYHLQFFDVTAGIRPGTIISVIRDQQGFVWVLYPHSVQRFDGRNNRIFRVPGYDLNYLHCDAGGVVWIGSPRETWRYSESRREFVSVPLDPLPQQVARGVVFDMPGRELWQITTIGFYRLSASRDRFEKVPDPPAVPSPYNTRFFADKDGVLFFGHANTVYRYNRTEKTLDSLPDYHIRKIFPVNGDSVLISSWSTHSWWYNFSKGTINEARPPRHVRSPQVDGSFGVRGLVHVGGSRVMIPSVDGLYEYDLVQRKYRRLLLYHKGRSINSGDLANNIYVDREGFVWLTTVDGIARFPLQGQFFGLMRIKQLQDQVSVGVDNIRAITEDRKGNLWLATGNGFVCWKRQSNEWIMHLPKEGSRAQLAFPSVRGITYDDRYIILGPTDLGIWMYDPERNSYRRPVYDHDSVQRLSEHDFFDGVTTLRNGNHIFPGRDALYELNGKDYRLRQISSPANGENFNFVIQTGDGFVWVATQAGLHLFNQDMQYLKRVEMPDPISYISSGYALPDNRFLLARGDGLYTVQYKDSLLKVERFSHLLDNVFVTSLFRDDAGYIWATSENGIYRLDTRNDKLNLYDFSDNVQGYGFNTNSWYRSRDGVLFIGGTNGLNYVRPEHFALSRDTLQVFIEEVKSSRYDSVYYALDREAGLSYSDRSIEVHFASPYFSNPEKVHYRYQIEGFDAGWNYTGNNPNLRLTSLPPGRYRLTVEASLNQADWFPSGNSFLFRIHPPFWMTTWFIALCFLALVLLAYLVVRNRNQKIHEKQEELEAEQLVHYFSSGMEDQHSVESILWDVARNCIGRLHFEDCVIYLYDENRKVLVQAVAYGPGSPGRNTLGSPIEIPLGKGITGAVAASGRAELIADTSKDPRYIVDDQARLSEITVPIMADGELVGVIDCEHSRKGFFTKRHLTILSTIASICASKIVRLRTEQQHRATEQKLMATRQKMVEVEMQALRAQMNPHFIFNCLNSINRYIVKSDQATASLYLTRFAKLIRLILDNSNSQAVTLGNELEALRLYIEMETIRFEKQFSYHLELEPGLPADSIYVPPLIIQPFVENAIWHGLLHKEEQGELWVRLRRSGNQILECVIEDNGVGRDKARELRSKSASTRKSLGMKLTYDRLHLLSRENGEEPVIDIHDVYDKEGNVCGTRVTLRIPIDADAST